MAKSKESIPKESPAPAMTHEAREAQMIALAVDCAEKQLREGTASSQLITHYLKMNTAKYKAELEKVKNENKLLEAKTQAIESAKDIKELYAEAMESMKRYGATFVRNEDED